MVINFLNKVEYLNLNHSNYFKIQKINNHLNSLNKQGIKLDIFELNKNILNYIYFAIGFSEYTLLSTNYSY